MLFTTSFTFLLEFLIQAFAVYLLAGVFFYLFFVFIGMKKLDESTRNTNIWFKIIIGPASIYLWPILLYKLLKL
ncbi:hypothetical protein [Marinifilum caeruleilacunae]|uniref:Cardiolipin synthase N-terminal domain-containing protein n=1 Tax=Marinifilum caeruleilacunae TaxID=2499076 RepID=A0ABX1WZ08_9BACT|nr:hypothetical protein [Marinifilum caeruleilacunae]NOU61395.1 hypothetical protein [Marinifilum caeruleilacunae]